MVKIYFKLLFWHEKILPEGTLSVWHQKNCLFDIKTSVFRLIFDGLKKSSKWTLLMVKIHFKWLLWHFVAFSEYMNFKKTWTRRSLTNFWAIKTKKTYPCFCLCLDFSLLTILHFTPFLFHAPVKYCSSKPRPYNFTCYRPFIPSSISHLG